MTFQDTHPPPDRAKRYTSQSVFTHTSLPSSMGVHIHTCMLFHVHTSTGVSFHMCVHIQLFSRALVKVVLSVV